MKRTWKALVGVISAAAMAVAGLMGVGTAVADTTAGEATDSTVTINGVKGESYGAYELMTASIGSNDAIVYTVSDSYRDVLKAGMAAVTGEDESGATDAEIIETLGALKDSSKIQTFANAAYKKIKAADIPTNTAESANDSGTATFPSLPQGYYLFASQSEKVAQGHTATLAMLGTAGRDQELTLKADSVTLTKKVKDSDSSTGALSDWQDAADYAEGESIPFKLVGTVPDKIDAYDTYKYVFHDTESQGLKYEDGTVSVKVFNGATVDPASYKVASTENGFTVSFADLKTAKDTDGNVLTLSGDTQIEVDYSAKLTSDAVEGSTGNPNTAYLEFSNDPYNTGLTGQTPPDKVTVFTYGLKVTKTDGKNPLKGAGFTLYKVADGTDATDTATGTKVGDEQVNTESNTFAFERLDAGTYKLVESTVPAGYNKADDMTFTINATYDTVSDDPQLKTLTTDKTAFAADLTTGIISTEVVDTTGSLLPSTGGMGTTLLYVGGGILVVAAGVYFGLRRRKASKN
ncbi:MAG: isopeptide-forming domain-containing fimbrial protein [Bifidobacteriaceae bacterium]|jgi:fimbrial isopeptide formation D2 family protein/LPXTG-motif cell wall-anchored protein|nr:isopeptide-forming domain-containing fimbrial protein [Bifidobacteriaceae bacterium]